MFNRGLKIAIEELTKELRMSTQPGLTALTQAVTDETTAVTALTAAVSAAAAAISTALEEIKAGASTNVEGRCRRTGNPDRQHQHRRCRPEYRRGDPHMGRHIDDTGFPSANGLAASLGAWE